jgi:predicted acetyltransferase
VSIGGEDDEVEIRLLRADDDLDAQLDLSERAFGVKSADERTHWRQLMAPVIKNEAFLGVFAGDRPAGAATFFDMRQWWCGRAVPMAGVSGGKVAPEDRGRGIGRRMMTALLDEIAVRGFPLSALFPATMPLYRSLGWELAGGRYSASIPARSLRALMPADAAASSAASSPAAIAPRNLRRASPADAAAVIDVIGRAHEAARACGPLTWDAATMAIDLAKPDLYSYLCDDGFTSYKWHNGNENLFVEGVHGASADTVRELWSVIASHASTAEFVHAWIGPADPLWWLTRERDANIRHRSMWMLRVIDAPAAIAARGFPPAVSLDLPLIINDQSRPANSGRWMLSVAGGKGELVPAAQEKSAAGLTLGARGLAALYAGTPVATLRFAGLAAGDGNPDADAALDSAFAAHPYMLDAF